jgi:hypothetical protein
MSLTGQRINEAVDAALKGVPHDLANAVGIAVKILKSIDAPMLPIELQDEFDFIVRHSLGSPEDVADVAERIAYLASVVNEKGI